MGRQWEILTLILCLGSGGLLLASIFLNLFASISISSPTFQVRLYGIMPFLLSQLITGGPMMVVASISLAFSISAIKKRHEWDTSLGLCIPILVLDLIIIACGAMMLVLDAGVYMLLPYMILP